MSFNVSSLTSIVNDLTAAGITPSNAFSAAKGLLTGNGALKATLMAQANQMIANEGNAANIQKIASNIATTPGATPMVIAAANAAATAATQTEFTTNLTNLEAAINAI
jgi:hypothetical protein